MLCNNLSIGNQKNKNIFLYFNRDSQDNILQLFTRVFIPRFYFLMSNQKSLLSTENFAVEFVKMLAKILSICLIGHSCVHNNGREVLRSKVERC